MAGKTAIASNAVIDLAHYEARMSADGRLLHYARGRIRAFWLRQTLTVFGSLTVLWLESVPFGLVLAALAVVGELVDIAALRWVIRRLEAGQGAWSGLWPCRVAGFRG